MPVKHTRLFVFLPFLVSTATVADCACTNLEVKYNTSANSTAQSTQYCVADTANFAECTEVDPNPCGAGMKGYTCPIGGASGNVPGEGDWIGVGLEYVLSGTDLDSCTIGLALQRSITEDDAPPIANDPTGYTAPVGDVNLGILNATIQSGDTNDIPHAGTVTNGRAIFVSDNYAQVVDTQTIKQNVDASQISFSDLPSTYLDPGDDAKRIVQEDVFLASVRNAAGDAAALCGCQFTITAIKDTGSTMLTAVGLNPGPEDNCTYTDVPQP